MKYISEEEVGCEFSILELEQNDSLPIVFPCHTIYTLFIWDFNQLVGCKKVKIKGNILQHVHGVKRILKPEDLYRKLERQEQIKILLEHFGGIPEILYWE